MMLLVTIPILVFLTILVGSFIYEGSEERTNLAARADSQHRQILRGDDRGIYGLWPPDADYVKWTETVTAPKGNAGISLR